MSQDPRQSLRLAIRHRCQTQDATFRDAASTKLVEQVRTFLAPPPQRIALFFSYGYEISTEPLIRALWQRGDKLCLPVLHPFTPGHLLFVDYHSNTQMTTNRFQIPEPVLEKNAIRLLSELDYILMPLVGFDAAGHRLGMGGGFYDRTLANVRSISPTAKLYGVAFDCQQEPSLPHQPWDIPLDGAITPSRLLHFTA